MKPDSTRFTISLHNFKIQTIIGVLPKERENPQEIIIDLDIKYARKGEIPNDEIPSGTNGKILGGEIPNGEILDYARIYDLILEIFEKNHFLYLEDALDSIKNSLLARFSEILFLRVSIKKPHILKDCIASVSLVYGDSND